MTTEEPTPACPPLHAYQQKALGIPIPEEISHFTQFLIISSNATCCNKRTSMNGSYFNYCTYIEWSYYFHMKIL
jgi:hypothetical protein